MDRIGRGGDRRRVRRGGPEGEGWRADALLRPGLVVRVVNIGSHGALVESQARLRPGRPAELQLLTTPDDEKRVVAGKVARCQVVALDPLCFRGAIVFDGPIEGGYQVHTAPNATPTWESTTRDSERSRRDGRGSSLD